MPRFELQPSQAWELPETEIQSPSFCPSLDTLSALPLKLSHRGLQE